MPDLDPPTERELVAYFQSARELELTGVRQQVSFGPFTALLVIGALQLATRHPTMTEDQKTALDSVVEQFRPWFAGTMGEQIIDMGNDPSLDR